MQRKPKPDNATVDSVRLLDTIMDHVAQEEADTAVFTEEENQWARRLRQEVDARLAELRAQLAPAVRNTKRPPEIGPEIQGLDRQQLLERLDELRQHPGVRFAHLDLAGLDTDDLRQLVAAILAPPQEERSPS